MRIIFEAIVSIFVALMIVGLAKGLTNVVYAGAIGSVPAMEAALGISRGGTRVVPQCGCTIRYIGARQVGPRTYDVRIEKLD